MTLFPVLAREMNILARRKGIYRARTFMAFAGLLAFGWALLLSASQFSFAALGKSIFLTLSSLAMLYALFVGVHATSDCVSEEKREGTLGLLFLTDLKSYDVILGKLGASSLSAAFALFAIIPMISLGLLVGGITLAEVAMVTVTIANALFFSLALGVFVSTLSTNERRAMFASAVTLFLLMILPFVFAVSFSSFRRIPPGLMAISPLYPFFYLQASPTLGLSSRYAWISMGVYHAIAWGLLIFSCLILPRFINDIPSRRFSRVRKMIDHYTFGTRAQRVKHRAKLLDRNAFLWLASRERAKPTYAWLLLFFFTGLHLWVLFWFPNLFFDFAVSGTILIVLQTTLKVWAASEVCSRLLEDRRSGALELLLSTPLGAREIVAGQGLALRRIFLKPVTLLVIAEVFMAVAAWHSGLQKPSPVQRSLSYLAFCSTLLLDFWALKWVGLWLSLSGKSIERILIGTVARVLSLPSLIFFGLVTLLGIFSALFGRSASYGHYLFSWVLVSVLTSLAFGLHARRNFLLNFRELAGNRFDSLPAEEPTRPSTVVKDTVLKKPPRFLSRKWVIRAGTSAIVLVLLAAFIRHLYWRHRLASELQLLRRQKAPTTAAEIRSYAPLVRTEENGAAVLATAGYVNRSGAGFSEWRHFRIGLDPGKGITAEEQESFKESLRMNGHQRSTLSAAAHRKEFQIAENTYVDADGLFTLASMDLMLSSAEANVPRGEEVIFNLLKLIRASGYNHDYLCLHALNCLSIGIQPLLLNDQLPDETLQRIGEELKQTSSINYLKRRLILMRAEMLAQSSSPLVLPKSVKYRLLEAVNSFSGFVGQRDKQLFELSRFFGDVIQKADAPFPEQLASAPDLEWLRNVTSISGPVSTVMHYRMRVAKTLVIWNLIRARLEVLRTAVAVTRFVHEKHQFPVKLDDLVPRYMEAVPNDPFSGEPLKLKLREDHSLAVYSVGEDRLDDHGRNAAGGTSDVAFVF